MKLHQVFEFQATKFVSSLFKNLHSLIFKRRGCRENKGATFTISKVLKWRISVVQVNLQSVKKNTPEPEK